ncbi:hypothetical protein PROFUN_08362 [Planoprotostelium fungivorum]|uniref:C2 domain-containing protein n=1 Tax=Planoprotostelium fungivorum TaxID=1890364 RepID=A0A2P6NI46_9EUKA|nr:hypothetical protein PROFUN_08362 [Planoprotostelium fungivorum]
MPRSHYVQQTNQITTTEGIEKDTGAGDTFDRNLLPKNVRPLRYDLHLVPNMQKSTFAGYLTVTIQILEQISSILLIANNGKIEACDLVADADTETVSIFFDYQLELDIRYEGLLNTKMMGFYISHYVTNGAIYSVAVTQMAPTSARKVFPCWDEPDIKAIFCITLTVRNNLTALSNMDCISRSDAGDGHVTLHFEPTPLMSTYLVAVVVGNLEYMEARTTAGVRVRLFTPIGRRDSAKFSLECTVKILDYFSEYYGIAYPLPKLDSVAIADMAFGAMEHWGLITYRDGLLLFDPKVSNTSSKLHCISTVAHELAHQWFGNLVTMKWWKEIWLNEGFATFAGTQAVDHLFPEWQPWVSFVTHYFNTAQILDGLENSHPVEVEVGRPEEIHEIFDDISYSKGASIIRMLSDRVGTDNFRRGLNLYLNRFRYSNAVTQDLWDAISETCGEDVKSFMDPYTLKAGYPLVTVETTQEKGFYRFTQSRFVSSGREDEDETTWKIQLSIVTEGCELPARYELSEREQTIHIREDEAWFKVNASQTGFYRVRYSAQLLSRLLDPIREKKLNSIDRIGIQNDYFALCRAGLVPLSQALTLVSAYSEETEYSVWSDLSDNFERVCTLWDEEENHRQLREYCNGVYRPSYLRLGWDAKPDETDLHKLTRTEILLRMGNNGDAAVVAEARNRFWGDIDGIPSDLRSVVFSIVVGHGGPSEYDRVLSIFRNTSEAQERRYALDGLFSATRPELIANTLSLVQSPALRLQEIPPAFRRLSASPAGRIAGWNLIRDQWDTLSEKMGSNSILLERTISGACSVFHDRATADEVEAFFRKHGGGSNRVIRQSIEAIRTNAQWLENSREEGDGGLLTSFGETFSIPPNLGEDKDHRVSKACRQFTDLNSFETDMQVKLSVVARLFADEVDPSAIPMIIVSKMNRDGLKQMGSLKFERCVFFHSPALTFSSEESLLLPFQVGEVQNLHFSALLYGRATPIHGTKEVTVAFLLRDYATIPLDQDMGELHIRLQPAVGSFDAHFKIRGEKLDKKDFLGKSDPYFKMKRTDGKNLTTLYTSEFIKNNLNPEWFVMRLTLNHIGPKDIFRFTCKDFDHHGKHDLIGKAEVDRFKLLQQSKTELKLIHPKKKEKKGYEHSGKLHITYSEVHPKTLLNIFTAGGRIKPMVACDVSGGEDYKDILKDITNIVLQHGEPSQKFPAWGLKHEKFFNLNGSDDARIAFDELVPLYEEKRETSGGVCGDEMVEVVEAANAHASNFMLSGLDIALLLIFTQRDVKGELEKIGKALQPETIHPSMAVCIINLGTQIAESKWNYPFCICQRANVMNVKLSDFHKANKVYRKEVKKRISQAVHFAVEVVLRRETIDSY